MNGVSSVELPDDGNCAFCAYLSGVRPYTIWRRGLLVASLITREQRGKSHVLVIPIRHAPTLLDINDDESHELVQELRLAAKAIDRVEGRPGISVWQNNGVPAGQAISHMHFHVAGTIDGGGTDWGAVTELPVAETDAIAARLTKALEDG